MKSREGNPQIEIPAKENPSSILISGDPNILEREGNFYTELATVIYRELARQIIQLPNGLEDEKLPLPIRSKLKYKLSILQRLVEKRPFDIQKYRAKHQKKRALPAAAYRGKDVGKVVDPEDEWNEQAFQQALEEVKFDLGPQYIEVNDRTTERRVRDWMQHPQLFEIMPEDQDEHEAVRRNSIKKWKIEIYRRLFPTKKVDFHQLGKELWRKLNENFKFEYYLLAWEEVKDEISKEVTDNYSSIPATETNKAIIESILSSQPNPEAHISQGQVRLHRPDDYIADILRSILEDWRGGEEYLSQKIEREAIQFDIRMRTADTSDFGSNLRLFNYFNRTEFSQVYRQLKAQLYQRGIII